MDETWIGKLTNALGDFLAVADVHTVISITVLSLLLKYHLWPHWKWPLAYLAVVPLFLSFIITPAMSLTPEVYWGGQWFVRQALYNGIVSEVLFHVGLPYLQKKWPDVFKFLEPPVVVVAETIVVVKESEPEHVPTTEKK